MEEPTAKTQCQFITEKEKKITFLPESSKIGIEPMKGGDLESHTPCAG